MVKEDRGRGEERGRKGGWRRREKDRCPAPSWKRSLASSKSQEGWALARQHVKTSQQRAAAAPKLGPAPALPSPVSGALPPLSVTLRHAHVSAHGRKVRSESEDEGSSLGWREEEEEKEEM